MDQIKLEGTPGYDTFVTTCKKLGLLSMKTEWTKKAMEKKLLLVFAAGVSVGIVEGMAIMAAAADEVKAKVKAQFKDLLNE